MKLRCVVSGGQTGVDRGALDAVREVGTGVVSAGGWCPPGRLSEDGTIPDIYPVIELGHGSYEERTLQNVVDSDGTAILSVGDLSGGTRYTAECCQAHSKPFLLIDMSKVDKNEAVSQLVNFVQSKQITVLNFAGPRASAWPNAQETAKTVLKTALGVLSKT